MSRTWRDERRRRRGERLTVQPVADENKTSGDESPEPVSFPPAFKVGAVLLLVVLLVIALLLTPAIPIPD